MREDEKLNESHLTKLLNKVRKWKPRDRIPNNRFERWFGYFKPPIPTRIVVFGKSGCGKSSLLNSLLWVAKFQGSNNPETFEDKVPCSRAGQQGNAVGGNTTRLMKLDVLWNMEFVDSRGYQSTDDDVCDVIKMICEGYGSYNKDMKWGISRWRRVFNRLFLYHSTRKMDFAVLVVSANNQEYNLECKPVIKAITEGTGCAPIIVVTSKNSLQADQEKQMHGKLTGIGALRALFVENYLVGENKRIPVHTADTTQHTKLCEVLNYIQGDYDLHLNGLDEHHYPFLKLSLMLMFILTLVLCLTGRPNIIYRGIPRDCTDINGLTAVSGTYTIQPDDGEPFNVYCDMATDGGGWTVFQRYHDGSSEDCNTWDKCKSGFGNLKSDHWLGNEKIHRLTATGQHELRIDLTSSDNEARFALYDFFVVGDETSRYRLTLGRYSGGDTGDSLEFPNDNSFSTKDMKTDSQDPGRDNWEWSINWDQFKGNTYTPKSTEMKIRRTDIFRYLIQKVHDIYLLGKNFTLFNLFV